MTTALLADSAVTNYRDALAGGRIPERAAAALLVEGLRYLTRNYRHPDGPGAPTVPASWTKDHPRSSWWRISVADKDNPGLVLHLEFGDAGDVGLLVDRALVVIGLRFRVVE